MSSINYDLRKIKAFVFDVDGGAILRCDSASPEWRSDAYGQYQGWLCLAIGREERL